MLKPLVGVLMVSTWVSMWVVMSAVVVAAPVEANRKSEKIIYGVNTQIGSLDPYLISGIDTYGVTGFIFEPLAKIEPATRELKSWLAEKWTIDKKTNSVLVDLRRNVKFHDGANLSCADLEFTYKSYLEPKNKGEVWRAMWSDVMGVKVVSPLKCRVQFSRLTYQGFRNMMTALRILPRSFYEKASAKDRVSQAVGTGPFKVVRFEAHRRLELGPFSNWWRPYEQSTAVDIIVRPVSDPLLAKQLLEKGELDFYEVPSGYPPFKANIVEVPSAFGHGFSLTVNMRNKILQNKDVRFALLKLWNRESLNLKIFAGHMTSALDIFSPHRPGYPTDKPVAYDLAEARNLLKKAGYDDLDRDGFLDKLDFKVLAKSHESQRWLGLYQSDAAKAGIKIRIERIDDEAQWWKLINEGKFDLLANDGALSEAPHQPVYHSKGSYNTSGLKNKSVDQLFDQLETEFSQAKRQAANRKLIKRLRDLYIQIPGLISMKKDLLISSEIKIDTQNPNDPWRWKKGSMMKTK